MNNNVLEKNDYRIQRNFQEEMIFENIISNLKKKCRCGHTQVVIKKRDRDYVLCTYCGDRLYYDDNKQKEHNNKVDKDNFISGFKKHIDRGVKI